MYVFDPKVNFAIVGAMKAGTTALATVLRARPDVYMPERKELNFHLNARTAYLGIYLPWLYERRFDPPAGVTAVGEASASSLYYPHALQGLRWYNRRMKVIVSLRNPVDRAYSHWNMNKAKGRDTRSFPDAVAAEIAKPFGLSAYFTGRRFFDSYLDRGFYAGQCETVLRKFPRENVLFLKSERMRGRPEATWSEICDFLCVNPDPAPEGWTSHVRPYKEPMDLGLRRELTARFEPDIRRLERLIGWDCSDWLEIREDK